MSERKYTEAEIADFREAARLLAELCNAGASLHLAGDNLKMSMSERKYTKAEIAKFKKAAGMLAELCQKGAVLYLAEDTLNLMSGPSHDEKDRPRQDRIVAHEWLRGAGGGDW
jgi:hypothetical protein